MCFTWGRAPVRQLDLALHIEEASVFPKEFLQGARLPPPCHPERRKYQDSFGRSFYGPEEPA